MRTTLVMNTDSHHNVRGGKGRVSLLSKDSRPLLLLLLLKIDFVGICSVNLRFITDEVGVPERGGKWIMKGRWAVGIRLQLQSLTGQKLWSRTQTMYGMRSHPTTAPHPNVWGILIETSYLPLFEIQSPVTDLACVPR